ncbi:MAG: NAD(P)/FAD-dependent oxidoreductase [Acidobacteriota bacterium]
MLETSREIDVVSTPEGGQDEDSFAPVVIIGAGPAGLTTAYELGRHGTTCTVLEQDSCVGGLARTEVYKGYCFDIGGHRFFTKVKSVQQMWSEVLGSDFLRRSRLSRIYYQSKFFQYPVEPMNALRGLGIVESALCAISYLRARLTPGGNETNLEDWLVARFGNRLYRTFFKTYTEKVWGISCREISADWAAQRIRGLSVMSVLKKAFTGPSSDGPKTLIQEFDYPSKGPGMMWTRTHDRVLAQGSKVLTGMGAERICWEPGRVTSVWAGGRSFSANHFVSTMPIRELIQRLDPAPPDWVLRAGEQFRYRDFLTVALIVKGVDLFPDNWIYVHDPNVKVGRIQNFNNWSPQMVPDTSTTCLGLEYFCFEGDSLWTSSDEDLVALARQEIAKLGLIDPTKVIDGTVVRAPKAYPVYDDGYQEALKQIRLFLQQVPNLQLVGRNGMHRYNNQDHSMLTGMLAARNILGQGQFDLWEVNADTDYHEDGFRLTEEEIRQMDATQPLIPSRVRDDEAARPRRD